MKLARGHVAFELGHQRTDDPEFIEVFPIPTMASEALGAFLDLGSSSLWPEVGSRSFVQLLTGGQSAFYKWLIVQEGNYAYAIGQGAGDWVKLIIGDYLACHVAWD